MKKKIIEETKTQAELSHWRTIKKFFYSKIKTSKKSVNEIEKLDMKIDDKVNKKSGYKIYN